MGPGPIRSCAGCRRRRPQAELIRIVRRPDGTVLVDPGTPEICGRGERRLPPRLPGRGVYVCAEERCVRRAAGSGALKRGLRLEGPVPPGVTAGLMERIAAQAARSEGEEGKHG
jgi:predicted RNA-binding protein YlxR (DUF448 family)